MFLLQYTYIWSQSEHLLSWAYDTWLNISFLYFFFFLHFYTLQSIFFNNYSKPTDILLHGGKLEGKEDDFLLLFWIVDSVKWETGICSDSSCMTFFLTFFGLFWSVLIVWKRPFCMFVAWIIGFFLGFFENKTHTHKTPTTTATKYTKPKKQTKKNPKHQKMTTKGKRFSVTPY